MRGQGKNKNSKIYYNSGEHTCWPKAKTIAIAGNSLDFLIPQFPLFIMFLEAVGGWVLEPARACRRTRESNFARIWLSTKVTRKPVNVSREQQEDILNSAVAAAIFWPTMDGLTN